MPFHTVTANMAALLRSARLLKCSPSGLLQITGTKRNGPPLRRLCSGVLGGRSTGGCSRLIRPVTENATSSRVWPHAVGCVRSYTVVTEKRDEASTAVQSKQAQHFDWALTKLDTSVKRTGRITKNLLLRIFHDICRTGYPSANQALLLLRSCGSLMPEVPLEERTMLAHRIWEKMQEMDAQFDVSHYNALLKVYLQNEFKFSPTDFLAKMEAANIQPNRVTYQRLITAYCQNGDIEGASTILGFMKSKDLPITEAVFNSLVTGHARAGDMENAKNILPVMRGAGIQPGPDTYLSLLTAYAEKGDMDSLKQTMEEAESADCVLMDRDILQIIFSLAKAGYQQHVPEMVERLRHERNQLPDAMNMCLSLITQGLEDTAFLILKNFSPIQPDRLSADSGGIGNFFLRHCVNMSLAAEKIRRYCHELQELNLHASPFLFSLHSALSAKNTGLSLELMQVLKEQDIPIKPHFFYPLLAQPLKDKDPAGVVEVVKGMCKLGVYPDYDILSNYIVCAFPSLDEAQQALQDAGVPPDFMDFLQVKVHMTAANDLAKFYTMLSDPSFPTLNYNFFRNNLIQGFRKCNDTENMVKIIELLHKDERFSKKDASPAESTGWILYGLIDSMSPKELKGREEILRAFFNLLHIQNITISVQFYRGIKKLLDSYNVPDLSKDVKILVRPGDKNESAPPRFTGTDSRLDILENKLAQLKAEKKPFSTILRKTIVVLCAEKNLQRALELKEQHEEDMTPGGYASLIDLCCRQGNEEQALNLKRELSRKDSSETLEANKYITLVAALSKKGRVEEAVDLLKEMKEKEVVLNDTDISLLFHAFNTLAVKDGAPVIQQLQDTVFTLGLAKPTTNLCSPLITAYLESEDLSGALEASLQCQRRYKLMPRLHDILVALMDKGDTELLQKVMDFVSQERGEMHMLYDLFFAFLHTGRYREARKIIETPGMRARPGRLQWYAEKCIFFKKMETLEQMVEMTAKLFECDRDEMYSYILRLCKETNNWEKAEAVWTKMQEENIIPRERTMRMLADILRNNDKEVPFEVLENWYEQAASTEQAGTEQGNVEQDNVEQDNVEQDNVEQDKSKATLNTFKDSTSHQANLYALCKNGKLKEALGFLKAANEKDVTFSASVYDVLIRSLLAEGELEDAMVVRDIAVSRIPSFQLNSTATSLLIITLCKKGQPKDALEKMKSMLQGDLVPLHLSITRLVQTLATHGDVAGIQEVESLVKSRGTSFNLSSMVFLNNTALAHIKNGDVESAVEALESVYTSPDSSSPSMSYVFRKVLEDDNDKALDKLSAMAERLANHFACYTPALDLFFQLLNRDKVEDAKFMLIRCQAMAEQKNSLISYLAQNTRQPGQMSKVKALLSLIPDFVEKEVLYPYLIRGHSLENDFASAKALYEEMQKEGLVVDELSLKRLAQLYRNAGETVPFEEPPNSFKFYARKLKSKTDKPEMTAEE